MVTEAQKKATARYHKKALKTVNLRLNRFTEADLIEQIEKQENANGYIKRLIREDIKRE